MTKENKILITTSPYYVLEQSDPTRDKFVWSYEITIANNSDDAIQLLNRFWKITETTGKIEEIKGAGVLGQQPLIQPGTEFIYTSYCQLSTPQGTMEGYYEMQTVLGMRFNVEIPKFILSAPSSITAMYKSKLH